MSEAHTSVAGPIPGGDRREQVDTVVATLNNHDAAGYAAFYTQDAVIYTTASPEPLRGRTAIEQDIRQWFTAMPDMVLQLEEVVVDGPTAASRLVFVGTHTGPLTTPSGEVPPTGQRVSVPMAVFSRQGADGLVIEDHRYLDMMSMAQQLGLA